MKSKQQFPYPFLDMHSHILPGVDDGSKDMEMSLAMAAVYEEQNVSDIIVTPHNNAARRSASPDGIRRRVEELQRACDDEGYRIRFYPGNECFYDSSLPERLRNGEALTLADSEYCLVEFYPGEDYSYILNGLRSVIYEGFQPVLAHCERYACLLEKRERAEELTQQGILLQCNADSVRRQGVTGFFDKVPAFVNGLLKEKLVSFISTDAHRPVGNRRPELLETAAYVQKKYGEEYASELLWGNAAKTAGLKVT